MKKNHIKKHRLKIADCITVCRIAGTLILFALRPLSTVFFIVYSLTGLTDVLDGWIARKTETADSFGARLDSIADMLFYAVMLFRMFPVLWNTLPSDIWYAASGILVVRISAYLLAAVKYRQFASMHSERVIITGRYIGAPNISEPMCHGRIYLRKNRISCYTEVVQKAVNGLIKSLREYTTNSNGLF